jgi:HEAT repeat protein
VRGFSTLALGVLGDTTRRDALVKILTAKDEKILAGAAAVALGIMGDPGAIPFLRQVAVDSTKDDDLRGYATLALSMMGDRTTLLGLSRAMRSLDQVDYRRSATLSTGLAQHQRLGPTILRSLFMDSDPRVRGAAINSLVLLPRKSVLGTVLDVADGAGYAHDSRVDAIFALGAMAERGRPSSLERLLDGINYRSLTVGLTYATRLF